MVTRVFPDIRRKMFFCNEISVQCDNARPHAKKSIQSKIECAGKASYPIIRLKPQPAESPDLNSCDLGFFSSLDKETGPSRSFDIQKLQLQIEEAFYRYPEEKLEKLFRTKELVIREFQCKTETKTVNYVNK